MESMVIAVRCSEVLRILKKPNEFPAVVLSECGLVFLLFKEEYLFLTTYFPIKQNFVEPPHFQVCALFCHFTVYIQENF